jgi:hypothetical protein
VCWDPRRPLDRTRTGLAGECRAAGRPQTEQGACGCIAQGGARRGGDPDEVPGLCQGPEAAGEPAQGDRGHEEPHQAGLLQAAINRAPAPKKPFFEGLRDLTYPPQPPNLAAQVWDQCKHGTSDFLTWHRIFLYNFEQVLQGAANDKSLRLPYWDYTDPAQVQLPAEFAQPTLSGGGANSLYDPRRRSQTVKLDPGDTDIDSLLQESDYGSFSSDLEDQPHGTTHCAVGPGCPYPLMGKVAVAGTDPIFWLHHANIDRIFECWQKSGGTVPSDLKDQPYPFIDATGALVTMKYSDLPLDYTYDHVNRCGRKPTARLLATPQALAPQVTSLAKVQGFAISDASAAVSLPLPKSGPPADRFRNSLLAPAGPTRTKLVLDDITAEGPPGVLFKVYLSTAGPHPRRQYVATLSFFGVEAHDGHAAGGGKRSRHIDVTEKLKALKGKAAEMPAVQVVFEAADGTASSTLQTARALFDSKSGLRVGSVELQVR